MEKGAELVAFFVSSCRVFQLKLSDGAGRFVQIGLSEFSRKASPEAAGRRRREASLNLSLFFRKLVAIFGLTCQKYAETRKKRKKQQNVNMTKRSHFSKVTQGICRHCPRELVAFFERFCRLFPVNRSVFEIYLSLFYGIAAVKQAIMRGYRIRRKIVMNGACSCHNCANLSVFS